MNLPTRWRSVKEFFETLLAPWSDGLPGHFVVEANGPDGEDWTSLHPRAVSLDSVDAHIQIAREVAGLCGATRRRADPDPAAQRRHGIFYSPAVLSRPKRSDRWVVALLAVILDVDDRNHGSRKGTLSAAARVPSPTALVHSGGGVQAVYVLREALAFDQGDPAALAETVRSYLRVALSLQHLAGADPTHWPSHLFRCPGAYHLKDPSRPVLVTVDLDPARQFNLPDFDEFTGCVDPGRVEIATTDLVAKLRGEKRVTAVGSGALEPLHGRVRVPRLVSSAIVRLLNEGVHPAYTHPSGVLDRSRAVYGAATSLLAAGVTEKQVVRMLASSALRGAIEDRGAYGPDWLARQVAKAAAYLAQSRRRGHAS